MRKRKLNSLDTRKAAVKHGRATMASLANAVEDMSIITAKQTQTKRVDSVLAKLEAQVMAKQTQFLLDGPTYDTLAFKLMSPVAITLSNGRYFAPYTSVSLYLDKAGKAAIREAMSMGADVVEIFEISDSILSGPPFKEKYKYTTNELATMSAIQLRLVLSDLGYSRHVIQRAAMIQQIIKLQDSDSD